MTRRVVEKLKAPLLRIIVGLALVASLPACTPEDDTTKQPAAEPPLVQAEVAERGVIGRDVLEPQTTARPRDSAPTAAPDMASTPLPVARATRDDPGSLLGELQSLNWDGNGATAPASADLLQRLRLQGAAALAPIRDVLLGGDRAAEVPPKLRLALLEVLLSIGSPEVEDVALQLLASGPSAPEVLELGLYLETVEPGGYSNAILLAAEQALISADPSHVLPAEFFQLLGALGTEETASLLADVPDYHEAYADLALVAIPDGGGLAPLEREARLFASGRDTVQGRLAIQLLAQMAPRDPRAAAALLDLAGQGVIPEDVWAYVLDIVAGEWEWTLLEPQAGDRVGSHTYYSPQGNQVIYRVAVQEDLLDEDLQDRRHELFEQLQASAP